MAETDSVLEGEILNHGPSVDSLVIVLKEMKKAGRLNDVIQVCMKFLSVYPVIIWIGALQVVGHPYFI